MILFLLLACADDLRDTDHDGDLDVADSGDADTDADSDTDADTDTGVPGGRVTSVPEGGTGTTYVDVDATDSASWVYFDFASPTEVTEADGWELTVQRYDVKVNGGTSGPGGIDVAYVEGATLEEVSAAPADGWVTDTKESPALGGWYDYDEATHVLTAHPRVYVLRNGAGGTWKLQFVDYYDDAGNSGHPSFRWAALGG